MKENGGESAMNMRSMNLLLSFNNRREKALYTRSFQARLYKLSIIAVNIIIKSIPLQRP